MASLGLQTQAGTVFSIGDQVEWRFHDDEIPFGTVGTVTGFREDCLVTVKFPNIDPDEFESTDLISTKKAAGPG